MWHTVLDPGIAEAPQTRINSGSEILFVLAPTLLNGSAQGWWSTMIRLKTTLMITVTLLMASACAGEFDMYADPEGTEVRFPGGMIGEDGKIIKPGDGTTEQPVETIPLTPGFTIEKTEVRLLPFHIRMEKLSRVTGLALDDPLFDELWGHRYDLGDHNYGQGIGPDLSWNASKMSVWVESLQPVCNSEAVAVKFPSLPDNPGDMISAAYGRPAGAEDLADFQAVLGEVPLDEAARYQSVCLAILTSSEFVAL